MIRALRFHLFYWLANLALFVMPAGRAKAELVELLHGWKAHMIQSVVERERRPA